MKQFWIALRFFILMTVLTGVAYPLIITGIAQLAFKNAADGSMIYENGVVIGSELIGQNFQSPRYFWGRPSSSNYNALPSSASNLGPTSKVLKKQIEERKAALLKAHPTHSKESELPIGMLFASGSGLDPQISPTAIFQVERVIEGRGWSKEVHGEKILRLIQANTKKRFLGVFGKPGVNVLKLNIALDDYEKGLVKS